MLGLTIAFDERTLTDYFASRPYTYVYFLIAKTIASKGSLDAYKEAFASIFAPKSLAPNLA